MIALHTHTHPEQWLTVTDDRLIATMLDVLADVAEARTNPED